MLRLCSKLEIVSAARRWTLDYLTSVEITRDTEKLTDECKITLPKSLRWDNAETIPLKRGDKVKVWLGYDDELQTAFSGYIREVGFKTPLTLVCEDEMFVLKQLPAAKKAYTNATLATLLADQNTGYQIKVTGEQRLGAYRVTANTVAELLDSLAKNGIRSFFRTENDQPVLYAGVLFSRNTDSPQVFATGSNIVSDSSLKQQSEDEVRIKLKAVSILHNNKKIRIELGDKDGELRTINAYNKTEPELKAWAEQELQRLKTSGISGSFTTFGAKLVDKLDCIALRLDGEKKGVYQVKKNVIKYGPGGFRQEITLGLKVRD